MAEGKILPYLDIPFQHASPRILKLMKRPGNQEKVLERIRNWRTICPELVIRSTFIVGFPGESEEDFQMLLDFLEEAQLDRVGCFKYSAVEGATANELANPVPEAIKEERWQRFMAVQQKISSEKLSNKIGSVQSVIIDGFDEKSERLIGRSFADAPEIDGQVLFEAEGDFTLGDIVKVNITASDDYDLYGELAG
jgi:ribosomal protein S12 methylthiotransferase